MTSNTFTCTYENSDDSLESLDLETKLKDRIINKKKKKVNKITKIKKTIKSKKKKDDEYINNNIKNNNNKKTRIKNKKKKIKNNNFAVNCIECKCGDIIRRGSFEEVEIDCNDGHVETFYAFKEKVPCTTNNCIWQKNMNLCWILKQCTECKKHVGYYVVSSVTEKMLDYVGNILLLPQHIKLVFLKDDK